MPLKARMRKAAEKRGAAVESPSFDPEVPSIARTYDYLLGGKDNFPADREVGEIFIQRFPGAVDIALDNRACLVRAVRFIADELGIVQFLDLGSGLWPPRTISPCNFGIDRFSSA